MNEHMETALSYAERGWQVLPLHRITRGACSCGKSCSAPGKHPRISSWRENASRDPKQIRTWWRQWLMTNVGIVTGKTSGLVVIDIDPLHGGDESAQGLAIPDTFAVRTGSGGRHLYLRHPGPAVPNSVGAIAPGIDLRGDGGYVVAPPSNHISGGTYELLADVGLADLPSWVIEAGRKTPGPASVHEGKRNTFLASEAGKLRHLGIGEDELRAKLLEVNVAKCNPPLDEEEVASIAASIAKYPAQFPQTDLGNAERFQEQHGSLVRHCAQQRSWYVWDERRWRHDLDGQVMRLAAKTARSILIEAAQEEDEKARKELLSFARASESAGRMSAMVRIAESSEGVAIRPEVLDQDPWRITVLNGTLDLKTGDLQSHRPEDLITKLAPVSYDPDARSELWNRFLEESTGGDEDLAAYLQRAAGYSLTGRTTEHAVFFIYGPPATGKSRFTSAIKTMLGDYAIQTAFETFLAKRFGGGASNDIADLAGARLVLATEADRGRRFAEATLKHLTGGDTVMARQLYQRNFEFTPTFKLWLCANDAPRVNNDDDAMFRRMNVVPFEHIVPEERRDKNLGDKLAGNDVRSAILAWAMAGCLAWQRDGLRPPAVVTEATAAYREEQDPLRFFLEERCTLEATAQCAKADLWALYLNWAKGDSIRFPLTKPEFSKRVQRIPGVTSHRGTAGKHMWRGIDDRKDW